MTSLYDVPTGWLGRGSSRSPLLLVNAYAFARSATPLPDQWTHFAKLRPVSRGLIIGCAVIAGFAIYGAIWMLLQMAQVPAWFGWPMFALFVVGALFFGWAVVASLLAGRVRTGWPHLHGIGLGESGVSIRIAGQETDVPWPSITAVRATHTNADQPGRPQIPVLRLEYDDTHLDLNTMIFGASPLVTFWALTYYSTYPQQRGELGTSVAQERMDKWLRESPPVSP